jgi:alpha-methylacyl-CoA racemase
MMLSDLGADVIRIDRPGSSDRGGYEEVLGRGRRSIALDLKSPDDLETALRLVAGADVLIDPFRPGTTERLGLGPDVCRARNARLVYARITGWGQDGPLAHTAGHDINFVALAGALEAMGPDTGPPPVPLNAVGDFGGGGMLLVVGVLAALYERSRSGEGDVIDVAMVDGTASLLAGVMQLLATGEWSGRRFESWVQGAAPWYRTYRTADGRFVSVGALEPQFYVRLLEALGLDPGDWPQFDQTRWPELHERLAEAIAAEPLDEWVDRLEGTDVCFAPALPLRDAAEHPHLRARGTYVTLGGVLQPAPAPRFLRHELAVAGPAPVPGAHTSEILAELDEATR